MATAIPMTYVWLGLMILFILVEAAIPGLVSVWFALGALLALVFAAIGSPVWLQALIFILGSGAALLLTRPLAKKYVNSKKQATNADAVIGRECLVTERIDNVLGTGAVKTGGKIWTAVAENEDIQIEAGELVRAKEISGVKLVVEPFEKEKKEEEK